MVNFESQLSAEEKEQKGKLIEFFEQKGYEKLRSIGEHSVNFVFIGEKDKQEYFIKKYNRPVGVAENINVQRTNTEIACYQNLPKDMLIDFIEADANENYIILKKVEFEDIEKDERAVGELIDFALTKFSKIDASFLKQYDWEGYENLFKKFERIEKAGAIEDAEAVKQMFIDKKELIENAPKIFSHLDYNFLNVKKLSGKIIPFDFENALNDNAMVDMAVLYIEICDDDNLLKKFKEEISAHELYDEELLRLMIIRRCAIVVNAGLGPNGELRYEMPFRKKNINLLRKLVKGGELYPD